MGAFGVLARLLGLTAILLLSYVLAEAILQFGAYVSEAIGVPPVTASPDAQIFEYLFLLAAAVFVGALLTAPLALAMFGHAGAWIKHVAAKSARFLFVALLFAFALELGAAGATGIQNPASGLAVILVLGGIGTVLLALSSPASLLAAIGQVVDCARESIASRARKASKVAAVELRMAPTSHVRGKEKPERIRMEVIRFQRLVQALVSIEGRVELRLSFRQGRGRILLLARGASDERRLQERILGIVRAHLPEFDAQSCDVPEEPPLVRHSVGVIGAPEATENPLEPLSRYFLENGLNGDYQVIMERTGVNPFRRQDVRMRQRSLAQKAEGQKTKESAVLPEQQTSSLRDHSEQVRLEEMVKAVERYESSLALKCWVSVTGLGPTAEAAKTMAEGASSTLIGSLSSHRSISALKTVQVGRRADRLDPVWRHALLVPAEVVPFAWIPQVALGTEVAPTTEFELPPKLEGEIELGTIVVHSNPRLTSPASPLTRSPSIASSPG